MKKIQNLKLLRMIGVLLVVLIVSIAALDQRLIVRTYFIEADSIDQEIRLALITDLHSCLYGVDQADLNSAIDAQSPDLILLGGDICDDCIPHDNTELLLKSIAHRYPCYYVTGNHEYWTYDIETVLALFQHYGVTVLDGSFDVAEIGTQKINICGISDPERIAQRPDIVVVTEQLDALDTAIENDYFSVLLSHRPELIGTYLDYDYDLILSGHAHGGQWRLPGLINGLLAPNQGFFPEYAGGQYNFDNTTFIVSRGLATVSTRVPRVFNRPELVMISIT